MNSICLSYLYNWCAASGLSGTACSGASNTSTGANFATAGVVGRPGGYGGESKGNTTSGTISGNQDGVNSDTIGTICPAGWRLPVGMIGSSDNTKNEYAILNGSMNAGTLTGPVTTGTTGYYQNWLPAGFFASIASGRFFPGQGLRYQSLSVIQSSSSLMSAGIFSFLGVGSTGVSMTDTTGQKYFGYSVRCVM